MALTYLTKAEAQGKFKNIDESISNINLALYGRDPNYPIAMSDLGSDVLTDLDKSSYLKRGETIPSEQLPTKSRGTYIDQRTQGVVNWAITAPTIIDEVYNARGGELSLDARLDKLSPTASIIASINASTEVTKILKTQIQVSTISHNELADRDVADCHPQAAITDLTSDLSAKANSANILAIINASTESTKIVKTQIQVSTINHNELAGRSASDCHDITAITGLDSRLTSAESDASDALGAISDSLSALGGYSSLTALMQCFVSYFDNLDPGGTNKPACALW